MSANHHNDGSTTTAAAINNNSTADSNAKEEDLRKVLRRRLHILSRREPLDTTYKQLVLNPSSPLNTLSKDPLYKEIKSRLRARVEAFTASGGLDIPKSRGRERDDAVADRTDAEVKAARKAAFTLREGMPHEQRDLVASYLAAETNSIPHGEAKRRRMEHLASALQDRERRQKERAKQARQAVLEQQQQREQKHKSEQLRLLQEKHKQSLEGDHHKNSSNSNNDSSDKKKSEDFLRRKTEEGRRRQEVRDRETEEKDRIKQIEKQKDRERQRERSRILEDKERLETAKAAREEDQRRKREAETPKEATHRLYEPIFKVLWDMEFSNLGGTNPFRIVINKDNCVSMGAPDYFDLIKKPMNLTYIQEKVDRRTYENFEEFLGDVKLLITNALLYNSDPTNEYHLAAKKMKKKFIKLAQSVLEGIEPNKQQTSE